MRRAFILLMALAGAIAASQFPEYVQQYQQRLGGATDELASFVADFDEDAARHDLSRSAAIERYRTVGDDFLGRRGARVVALVERYERLDAHRRQLQKAGPLARVGVFARTYDRQMARATAAAFRPAVPVTVDGALHAAAGFGIGLVGGGLLFGVPGLFRRRRAGRA